jgi:hypothetical protein
MQIGSNHDEDLFETVCILSDGTFTHYQSIGNSSESLNSLDIARYIHNRLPTSLHRVANNSGWECYEEGGPACYGTLNAVDILPDGEAWSVGNGGMILHSVDRVWNQAVAPYLYGDWTLYDIDMVSATEGWAVGIQ